MYIVEEEKEHVADLTGRQLIVGIWYTVLVLHYLDVCVVESSPIELCPYRYRCILLDTTHTCTHDSYMCAHGRLETNIVPVASSCSCSNINF